MPIEEKVNVFFSLLFSFLLSEQIETSAAPFGTLQRIRGVRMMAISFLSLPVVEMAATEGPPGDFRFRCYGGTVSCGLVIPAGDSLSAVGH